MAVPVPVTRGMCLCTIKGNLHSRRTDHDDRIHVGDLKYNGKYFM